MNLNDKRLGAYNKILKGIKSGSEPEPFAPPRIERSTGNTADHAGKPAGHTQGARTASDASDAKARILKELHDAQARLTGEPVRSSAAKPKNRMYETDSGRAGGLPGGGSADSAGRAARTSVVNGNSASSGSATASRYGSAYGSPSSSEKSPSAAGNRNTTELPGLIKVPSAKSGGSSGKESPFRKVAKFLLLIGVEEAAKVMSKLTPEQTEHVVLELASIRRVEPDEAAIVLAEFESLLKKASEPTGGVETARTILEAAFGEERAEAMLQKVVPDINGKPFDYLEDIDPDRLLGLIVDELPAVKALVLSRIKPKLAAAAIKLMTPDEKKETVLRLARLKMINPEVVRRVDDAMREKVRNMSISSSDSIDGRSALAEILKRMDGSGEKAILDGLSEADPDLGRDLRARLFTIEDIVRADDRFVQEVLRPMTEHDLAVLIIGKEENFRKKILANVSRNRCVAILDEEKIIAPVSRPESESVNGDFFAVMRRAWEDGRVNIRGRDDKEVWV